MDNKQVKQILVKDKCCGKCDGENWICVNDKEEWINLFNNNSKEEILELLIGCKFPL